MLSPTTTDDIQTLIAEWQGRRDNASAELEKALRNLGALETVLTLCTQSTGADQSQFGIHSHIRPGDIPKGITQLQGAAWVARRSGGRVKLADVARLLYSTGMSSGKLASIRSAIHSQLNMSDDWESEGEGTGFYRLLTFQGGPEPPPIADVFTGPQAELPPDVQPAYYARLLEAACPVESSPNDNGGSSSPTPQANPVTLAEAEQTIA